MKIQKMLSVWLICLIMASCKSSQEVKGAETQGADIFYLSKYEQTVPAFNGQQESALGISFSLVDTELSAEPERRGSPPVQASLAGLVRSILYDGHSAKEYADGVIESLTREYREALASNEEWASDIPWAWEYDEEHTITIRDFCALVDRTIYTYMGGAHPNTEITHFVIDVHTPQRFLLDDIILKAGFTRLKPIVERELRAYSELLSSEPLPPDAPLSQGIFLEDDFEMNDYYPAPDGLHFCWNAYDLAAYVYGPIEITVPWSELEGLLSPKGVRMADAFRL